MKKLLVLMLVLGLASFASASPVMKLGDSAGAFSTGSSSIEISPGGTYDLYVWSSSDLSLEYDTDDAVIPSSGLDNIQLFLQYDTTKVNLWSGAITKLSAVSGNPFGTTWSGRSQGTYNSLGFCEGALINMNGVDAYAMTKIMKITFAVTTPGAATTVKLLADITTTHDSFVGNSVAGSQFVTEGTMTFLPEPMTLVLLGLGGLFLRRRR